MVMVAVGFEAVKQLGWVESGEECVDGESTFTQAKAVMPVSGAWAGRSPAPATAQTAIWA